MPAIKSLIRKNILELVPYSSARDEYTGKEAVFMDANENPFNQPVNRYPDPQQKALKAKLSGMLNLEAERIFLGNGSDEAIDLLFRVFCEPGVDRAIIMDPSYGMYRVCADVNNVAVDMVELDEDFKLDASRVLAASGPNSKLIFLCSPNNPSSNLLDESEIVKILEGFQGIVVVDEAYVDFTGGKGLLKLLQQYQNLVLLRTLSKAWAAAGIRLGMALADRSVIQYMNHVKYPYNVNLLTQDKAMELIENEIDKDKWVQEILSERIRLEKELGDMDLVEKVFPSDANFLLIRVQDPDALYDYLAGEGLIVRNRSRLTHCSGCLRITVGTAGENSLLIEKLKNY